jgi:site-specific DNA recombinase
VDELFPFDPEDPKFLNTGLWECPNPIPNVPHMGVTIRVSTDKFDQNSSVENQMEIARDFAYSNGYQVVRILVVRESGLRVSSKPVFQEFLALAYAGLFDVVFVTELSRLTRRAKEMLEYIPNLYKLGVRVVSDDDQFDTLNSNWYAKLNELAQKCEAESIKISARQKRAHRARVKRGEYLGNQAPYGLERVGRRELRIAADGSAKVVRDIFQFVLDGKSPNEIAHMLTERKVATPSQRLGRKNAGERWHDTEVRKLLTNPVYCGHFQGPQSHVIMLGESPRKVIPKSERILNENRMESLIDQKTFDAVQKILASRCRGKDGRATNGLHKDDPLIDVLFCFDCGKQMHRVPRSWGEHYACSTHLKKGKGSCTGRHSVSTSALYHAVSNDIQLVIRGLDMEQAATELDRRKEVERIKLAREARQLQSSISSIENSLLDIQLARVENRISDFVADQLVGRQEAEKHRLSDLKHDLEKSLFMLNREGNPDTVLDSVFRIDMNMLIRTLINRIEIGADGEIQRIVYRYAFDLQMENLVA